MKKIDRQLTTTLLVLRIPARTTVRYTDMSKAHHRALIEISSNSFPPLALLRTLSLTLIGKNKIKRKIYISI